MRLGCLFGHEWDGCVCRRQGCGKTRDESHDYDDWVSDEPNLVRTRICRRCGHRDEDRSEYNGLLERFKRSLESMVVPTDQGQNVTPQEAVAEGMVALGDGDLLQALRTLKEHGCVRARIFWFAPCAEPCTAQGWMIEIEPP
jgi:hypothetical protein